MIELCLESGSNTPLSPDVPLFHTVMVLAVHTAPLSFFAGQTFHKLERYQEQWNDYKNISIQRRWTEMPVCTRLVAPLSRLAALKLPRIHELVVFFDHSAPNYLWKKHIAVNANLSGLTLLGLRGIDNEWSPLTDITQILRPLSALETLVIDLVVPILTFFRDFIPMETSGLNQSSCEGQISRVLCPRLQSLQIEGIEPTEELELMPVLKDIVTRHAIIGSPLKSFTFYFDRDPGKKWEMIGRDGSFTMEEVVPAQRFQLNI